MKAFAKRNSCKTVLLIFIGLAIAIFGMFSPNAYAKTAAEINADANRTLKRFYREVNGAKELTSSAKALLVMSGVTKAGFIVGGEYGQGVLRIKGKSKGYYNLVGGSYGFTAGAEQMDIIIAFMTEEALRQFKEIDGWEVGVPATSRLLTLAAASGSTPLH